MDAQEPLITYFQLILRLFLSALCGGLIGLEREAAHRFAGLRTHILVCIGSALIMVVSQYGFRDVLQKDLVVLDPSRVAAQVVSGIGFLGAGTILFWKSRIRGLTTAASLWATAGVGLAIGGGLYIAAISTTVIVLIVLAIIKPLERIFLKPENVKRISFSITPPISLVQLEGILTTLRLRSSLKNLQVQTDEDKQIIHLFFYETKETNLLKISDKIRQIPGVEKIETIDE